MMRRSVLAALAFVTFAGSAPGAETARASVVTNQTESRFRWNLKTLVGDYDRVGTRDPKWDNEARAALEGFARIRANPSADLTFLVRDVSNSVAKAVSAGCTDPMVTYVHARYVGRMRARTVAEEAEMFR